MTGKNTLLFDMEKKNAAFLIISSYSESLYALNWQLERLISLNKNDPCFSLIIDFVSACVEKIRNALSP